MVSLNVNLRQQHILVIIINNIIIQLSYDPFISIIRANPCPEVTDQFCRLPLPTLF